MNMSMLVAAVVAVRRRSGWKSLHRAAPSPPPPPWAVRRRDRDRDRCDAMRCDARTSTNFLTRSALSNLFLGSVVFVGDFFHALSCNRLRPLRLLLTRELLRVHGKVLQVPQRRTNETSLDNSH